MTKRNRTAKDIGMDSPTSETAKQQGAAGAASGPQEARVPPRVSKQPPQTSGRRSLKHAHVPTARKGYDAAEDPNLQGDGEPSPHVLKERDSLQGLGGHGMRGRAGHAEDVEERSHAGEPAGRRTHRGRQQQRGDRDPKRPT